VTVVALGVNCIVCRADEDAANEGFGAGDSALSVLVMVLNGLDPEQIRRDLCFAHRAHLERSLRGVVKDGA